MKIDHYLKSGALLPFKLKIKTILLPFAVYTSISGCSSPSNGELLGSWDLMEINALGMTSQIRLIIQKSVIISANTCSLSGKQITVETSSPIILTSNKIKILKNSSVKKEYSPGFLGCSSSIDKSELSYKLNSGNLILEMPGNNLKMELYRSSAHFKNPKQL